MGASAEDVTTAITGAQPTTTPEAQAYARKFLDQQLSGQNTAGESGILDEMSDNTKQAVAALRAAQQSMVRAQYDPRLTGSAVAGAMLAPTHSGSTSEGLSAGFDAYHKSLADQQQFNMARLQAYNEYGLKIPEADNALTQARMKLQELHEQQFGPLAKDALTVMGRSTLGGNPSMMSPNAKTALSEGLQPNTPQFFARVRSLDAIDQKNKAASAGTDENSYQEPDHSQQAYQFGVPSTAPYPWEGTSTKERRQMMNTERTSALKALQTDDNGVQQAQQVQRDLDRFGFLNNRTATSSWQGVPGINTITGFGQDAKEMDKISSRLGPLMRQPGMGRMTNLDLQTFMASTVGRDKPHEVNDSIRTAMGTAIKNQLDFNEFQHNYFAVHRTLQGARESWDQYLNANPIFDPTATPGSFKENKGRVDYKTYFRSLTPQGHDGGPQAAPSEGPSRWPDVTEADRQDPTFAGLSDDEIHWAKQPAKARGGPIKGYAGGGKVTADDDYQATLADLARSLEQGATFQWGDELNSTVSPGPYSQNITSERGQQERFGGSHPWSNFGLEAAGGMGTGMAAAKLGQLALEHAKGKAGAAGALASLVSRYTPRSLVPKAALAGAGAGAISGAGSAQDISQVPGEAAQQAVMGAVTGPLAGLVAKYGVNGAMALVDKMRGMSIPGGAQKVLGALNSDKTTVDEIAQRLRRTNRIGVPSNVADVGGPNVQALAQGVAAKPGPQVGQYMDSLAARQSGSNDRVHDLVNRALKPDDYTDKLNELTTNLYQNAKPLYEQAYAQFPRIKSDTIGTILGTKYGQKAGKQAYQLMQADGVPIGQADATGMIKKPSLQFLDYTKRALDDQITSARNAGDLNRARILGNMRDSLKNELDAVTANPNGTPGPYQLARQQYAGDLEVRDALTMGRDDFNTMSARDLRNATQNMLFAEKDALRTGAAESLFQTIGATPYTGNAAAKLANIPNAQDKLSVLFDKPSDYKSFMDALTQEMSNFQQSRTLLSTAAKSRASAASASLDPTSTEPAFLAASGHPLWAGARVANAISNKLMGSKTADQAADILSAQSDPAGNTILGRLKQQALQLQARQNTGNLSALGAAAATGPTTAPDPWGNTQAPQ